MVKMVYSSHFKACMLWCCWISLLVFLHFDSKYGRVNITKQYYEISLLLTVFIHCIKIVLFSGFFYAKYSFF